MARPIPPSNFKTRDGDVREDLRRIRAYLEELNDWLSDNSGDPNALTTVTGDLRYLKRAAADFTSFTAKSVPASADVVLLESAVDAFAKRYVTLSSLFTTLSTRNPVWDPPLVAQTDDDEFVTDTLASGVWTVAAESALGTPFTRAGDVDVSSYPAAGTFRSTLMGGSVLFQGPSGVTLQIYKAVTKVSAAQMWMAGVSATYGAINNVTTNDIYLHLQISKKAGAIPDTTNRMFVGISTNPEVMIQFMVTAGATVFDSVVIPGPLLPGRCAYVATGGGLTGGMFTRDGMQYGFNTRAGWGDYPEFVAFRYNITTGGNGGLMARGLIALHFIRRKAGTAAMLYG